MMQSNDNGMHVGVQYLRATKHDLQFLRRHGVTHMDATPDDFQEVWPDEGVGRIGAAYITANAPERLQAVIDSVADGSPEKRQSLLYVQTSHNGINSKLLGYLLVINGEAQPGSRNPEEWPYRTVADAIKDGWRIISFPNTALLMDPDNTYGIGPEFILEKMGCRF